MPVERFHEAQEEVYEKVVAELAAGYKRSHWIWFVFPQIQGLGHSANARFYALDDLDEAIEYLQDPILGERLQECCQLLADNDDPLSVILGEIDAIKLASSMTLFEQAAKASELPSDLFEELLERGQGRDEMTLEILESL